MSSLKDLREKAGMTQLDFGKAIYSKQTGKKKLSASYLQKVVSQWETGISLVPEEMYPAICEVLKIKELDLTGAKSARTMQHFVTFLTENGLAEGDAKLCAENQVVRDAALKAAIKSIQEV